jgi:3-oxoacyl-[acyl-carrier-protein] synthase II
MGALSRREDDPAGASRPFDRDRDGFVMGEGAGVIVLERAEFARARGARVYARLVGAAVNSDAHHITTPDRCGQVRALRAALASAGLTSADVAHVNAHATGTRTGDLVEAQAIGEAIGMHPSVSAPKSAFGHPLGAAGAVEAIVTALTVRDGVIPPTRNLDNQDPDIKLDVVTGEACHCEVPVAVSNSFGFGGHNVVLVIAKAS